MIFAQGDTFMAEFLVSEKIYNSFMDMFNDRNPMHTRSDFAVCHGFKDKVMHGNILNGFISYFVGEKLPVKNVLIHSQEIQYKNPVYLNEKLKFNAAVSGIFESVNVVQFKFDFRNSESKIVAIGKLQIGLLQ